ncbi:PH domain-containing protein [Microbispora sp. RL4-1S]|uniref:PH domain-containing protein n=1 Tax=Microbispora oryzae TaxID=2806554 RepID=A0A941ALV8_9ACTN|nr:PH domain-containing protein [Microbispora oryzae]MBP2708521.1 PH domain-containing protein [Microbispora oryzae]
MTGPEWQRLDPRMLAISLTWLVPPVCSTLLTLLITGGSLDLAAVITLGSIGLTFLIVAVVFGARLLTTRFRITGDRVELRSGAFVRRHRAVPRERIRSVDVTASPFHRALGLRVVRISAGTHVAAESRHLTLDGVSRDGAERLRRLLAPDGASADTALAVLRLRWLRYAPLTLWGVAGVGFVAGGFARLLDSLRINPAEVGFLRSAWSGLTGLPLWAAITVPVLAVVLLGALTSLVTFAETWWDYRLEAAGGDALRLRRGLFSTRSLWLERRRLRGVQITEPLPLRLARGARLNAIAVGLGAADDRSTSAKSALLPPASRRETDRVAAAVLREEPGFLTGLRLAPAPRAALRRRVTWGLAAVALVEAPLVILGVLLTEVLLHIAWISSVVLVPVALAAAVDAYRNLGSALLGRYLVTRCGTYGRRTVLLDRSGILAWSVDQSAFQRRAGLATLVAMVGAGRGGYKIRDVSLADGLALVREATPGAFEWLLEPTQLLESTQLLEPIPDDRSGPAGDVSSLPGGPAL